MRASLRPWGISLALVIGFVGGSLVFSEDEKVSLDKLPKAVVDAIKAKYPAAELTEAEKETDDGRTVYEVEFKSQGQKLTAVVAENGGILEVERAVAVNDLPKAVADAIKVKHQGAKIAEAEEVTEVRYEVKIQTADGKTIEVVYDASGVLDEEEEEEKN